MDVVLVAAAELAPLASTRYAPSDGALRPPRPLCAVRPAGTPLGGPQVPQLLAGGGKGKDAAAHPRRVLQDVTRHYAGSSKGGGFGVTDASGLPATSCHQDAQAASAAAKARVAAVRRQALRAMR